MAVQNSPFYVFLRQHFALTSPKDNDKIVSNWTDWTKTPSAPTIDKILTIAYGMKTLLCMEHKRPPHINALPPEKIGQYFNEHNCTLLMENPNKTSNVVHTIFALGKLNLLGAQENVFWLKNNTSDGLLYADFLKSLQPMQVSQKMFEVIKKILPKLDQGQSLGKGFNNVYDFQNTLELLALKEPEQQNLYCSLILLFEEADLLRVFFNSTVDQSQNYVEQLEKNISLLKNKDCLSKKLILPTIQFLQQCNALNSYNNPTGSDLLSELIPLPSLEKDDLKENLTWLLKFPHYVNPLNKAVIALKKENSLSKDTLNVIKGILPQWHFENRELLSELIPLLNQEGDLQNNLNWVVDHPKYAEQLKTTLAALKREGLLSKDAVDLVKQRLIESKEQSTDLAAELIGKLKPNSPEKRDDSESTPRFPNCAWVTVRKKPKKDLPESLLY